MTKFSNIFVKIILVSGILVLAEVSTRIIISRNLLPAPDDTLWHRREVNTKIRQISELKKQKKEGINVIFAGSSVAYTGIDPKEFDSSYELISGINMLSYNAGLAALSVGMNAAFFEHVFAPIANPDAIILAISPKNLNQNNLITQDVSDEVMGSTYGQAFLGNGIKARITQIFLRWSVLFKYRNLITLTIFNGFKIPESLPSAYDDPIFNDRGFSTSNKKLSDLLKLNQDPDPSNLSKLSLRKYSIHKPDLIELEKLIRYCKKNSISLILVNMPFSEFQSSGFDHPETEYELYLNTIRELSNNNCIPFWDLNDENYRLSFSADQYGDVFHLNDAGARILSKTLADLYWEYDKKSEPCLER